MSHPLRLWLPASAADDTRKAGTETPPLNATARSSAPADDTRRPARKTDPSGPVRMLRVLVVDANPGLTASLAKRLRSWGHVTREAHDGAAALAEAAAFRP